MTARPHARVTTILMAIALVTGVVACGNDDDDATTAEATEEPATTTGTTTLPSGAESSTSPETTETTTASTSSPETTSPETTSEPTSPPTTDPVCGPYGPLVTNDLNDRCEPVETFGPGFAADAAWNGAAAGRCVADMVAVPNELIVAVDPSAPALSEEVQAVIDQLGALPEPIAAHAGEALGDQPAQLVVLDPVAPDQFVDLNRVASLIPSLQRAGRSVDLNYLEPLQPNNGFRPVDDPTPAEGAVMDVFGGAEGKIVAVIDSPDEAHYPYDVDGNKYVDEDHGHGIFVSSIIKRSQATVDLYGVVPSTTGSVNPSVLGTGRWAPMTFSDAEIIDALGGVNLETSIVNMSLGGVGCPETGIGDRLALARIMNNMRLKNSTLRFVAAAGNNGADVVHFPAGWRHPALLTIADQIRAAAQSQNPPFDESEAEQIATEIKDMYYDLGSVIFAVGSLEEGGEARSDFSNYGCWVNAAAYGRNQIGEYPTVAYGPSPSTTTTLPDGSLGTYALWSGTSFATANFTAALATGIFAADPTAVHTETGARLLDYGLLADDFGQLGDCPNNLPTTP